jgi:SOS-response transcriptional repressor LexA
VPQVTTQPGDRLTDQQARILQYIKSELRTTGIPPSVREMCKEFEIASPNGIMCHLKALIKKGYLVHGERGNSRNYVPAVPPGCCPTCGRLNV